MSVVASKIDDCVLRENVELLLFAPQNSIELQGADKGRTIPPVIYAKLEINEARKVVKFCIPSKNIAAKNSLMPFLLQLAEAVIQNYAYQ